MLERKKFKKKKLQKNPKKNKNETTGNEKH